MALTISTGFVVDDAIVMIENIARYVEQGETPLRGRAQGLQADRLHDHLADVLADRGADPAAVHGRRGGPAVPRVRHHPGGGHPHFRGRLADPHADDVRAAAQAHAAKRATAGCTARPARCFERSIAGYGRMLDWVLDRQRRHAAGLPRHAGAHRAALPVACPKGFFPVQDTGAIQAHHRGLAVDLVCGDGRAPAARWPRRS